MLVRLALWGACFSVILLSFAQNAAISTYPESDKANAAAIQSFQFDSHGALLNAFVYVAAGSIPLLTVILLHGFPGKIEGAQLKQSLQTVSTRSKFLISAIHPQFNQTGDDTANGASDPPA